MKKTVLSIDLAKKIKVTSTKAFGAEEITNEFRGFLLSQCKIAHKIFKEVKLDERSSQIIVLLGSACQTASAISELSKTPEMFLAECVVLARGFLEKIINYCYLLVCDKEEYDRFLKHTIQKSYRKLDRKISLDGHTFHIKWTGKISLDSYPELKEALDEFTSESGKEKTHWTKVSLLDRIKIICENSRLQPVSFLLQTLIIYEDASEALHGTLYGCSFHTGAYDHNINKKDSEEINQNIQKNTALLLWQLGMAFHQAVLLLSENNDIKGLLEVSKHNFDSSFKLMESVLS